MAKKKYLAFILVDKKAKTNVYLVKSKSDNYLLGKIYWYFPWRQYIFDSYSNNIWSRGCLKQVMDFIEELMNARKKKPDKATKPRSPCEEFQCTVGGNCRLICPSYQTYLERLEAWRKG